MARTRYTTRRISKIDLHNLICSYPTKFRLGARISNTWFCNKLGLIQPSFKGMSSDRALAEANRFNLTRMSMYVRLNRQLALRGLVIRQQVSEISPAVEYVVQALEGNDERLQAYATKVREGQTQYARLSTGIRRYQSVWTRLTDTELDSCY